MERQNLVALGIDPGIVSVSSPEELACEVRLAFKRMGEERALIVFAQVMTSPKVPHDFKVAVWDAARYSHIWWQVDRVLRGEVMENPLVQAAFADAVPMRVWHVEHQTPGHEPLRQTLRTEPDHPQTPPEELRWDECLIRLLTRLPDAEGAESIRAQAAPFAEQIHDYADLNGNGFLWYLTYREEFGIVGGFSCPRIEKVLLDCGADPTRRNKLGLCWNDVRGHVVHACSCRHVDCAGN